MYICNIYIYIYIYIIYTNIYLYKIIETGSNGSKNSLFN